MKPFRFIAFLATAFLIGATAAEPAKPAPVAGQPENGIRLYTDAEAEVFRAKLDNLSYPITQQAACEALGIDLKRVSDLGTMTGGLVGHDAEFSLPLSENYKISFHQKLESLVITSTTKTNEKFVKVFICAILPTANQAATAALKVITIAADGALTVDGEGCPVEQLAERLKKLAARQPASVEILFDAMAGKRVGAVVEACEAAGLQYVLTTAIAPAAKVNNVSNLIDKNLTKQVSEILDECQRIAPGITRAEFLKIFTSEGGISTAKHRTFVHRLCPNIKVDVDFILSSPAQALTDEKPTDTVEKISKPYLERGIAD